MLIDIQMKLARGKGAGYGRWAKTFYLKDTAKILNLPVDNGLPNYDELASWAEQPVERFIAYHSPSEMIPVCATALHVR